MSLGAAAGAAAAARSSTKSHFTRRRRFCGSGTLQCLALVPWTFNLRSRFAPPSNGVVASLNDWRCFRWKIPVQASASGTSCVQFPTRGLSGADLAWNSEPAHWKRIIMTSRKRKDHAKGSFVWRIRSQSASSLSFPMLDRQQRFVPCAGLKHLCRDRTIRIGAPIPGTFGTKLRTTSSCSICNGRATYRGPTYFTSSYRAPPTVSHQCIKGNCPVALKSIELAVGWHNEATGVARFSPSLVKRLAPNAERHGGFRAK